MIPESDELFQVNDIRVKDREKAFIFDLLFRGKAKSRKEILAVYRLRPTVLTEAVKELLADGLVLEEKRGGGKSGRPEIILKPVVDRLLGLAVYVESRELKAALVNLEGKVIGEEAKDIPRPAKAEDFLELFCGLLDRLLEQAPAGSLLAGIGISPSGSIDTRSKRWLSTYRWQGLKNLDFSYLEEKYGCLVYVKKDLDSLLGHYLQREPAFRKGNTILFHWGFGVGFAYAQDGTNVNASHLRFGEIGHTKLDPNGKRPCICGARGCIETETAIWALLPELRKLDPGLADDEQTVARFCLDHPEAAELPALKEALEIVTLSFINLYRLFYPSSILLLGPFFSIPKIYRAFVDRVSSEIARIGAEEPVFFRIPDGYRGCVFANTRYVFSEKLKELLRAKF